MEFGLREILILVGLLIIGGILFDGYRRVRSARLQPPAPRDGTDDNEQDWEFYKGELPNGGARVVNFTQPARQKPAAEPRSAEKVRAMESAEAFGSALDDTAPPEQVAASASLASVSDVPDATAAPDMPAASDMPAAPEKEQRQPAARTSQSDLFADDDILIAARADQQARLNRATRKERPAASRAVSRPVEAADSEMPVPDFQEVLVINVMAKEGEIPGADLLRVLLSCGFRFGEMNIFHRYEQHSGKGAMLFSIANVVEPGVFDLDTMEQFSTPGICMFMKLPGPKRPMHAFEIMMDSARKIANLLEAEIKDEHHNALRQQTAEHYRQRVLDFERRLLSFQASQRQH